MTTPKKHIIWDQVAGGFLFDSQSVTYWPASAQTFSADEAATLMSRKDSVLGNKSNRYAIHALDSLDDLNRLIRTPSGEKLVFTHHSDDELNDLFQKSRLQQCQSKGANNSMMSAFVDLGFAVTQAYMPVSIARDVAEQQNPLPPIDYGFLKSHTLKSRAYAVDGTAASDVKYSVDDETAVLQRSKSDPDAVFFMISAGNSSKGSAYSSVSSVDSARDIAHEINEAFEVIGVQGPSDTPMLSFVVNDAVDVKAFYDEAADGVYIIMEADEVITTDQDLKEAVQDVRRALEQRGYYGAIAEKSFIKFSQGQVQLPFSDIPSIDSLIESCKPADRYAQLGLCHLYQNGACIARVSLSKNTPEPAHIILTHPADGVQFTDLTHAKSHTFGISNQISAKEAALYRLGNGNQTDMSTLINAAVDNVAAFEGMLNRIAANNAIPAEQAKNAFWDVFSGHVTGKDLRQYERMTQLYVDVVRQTAATFERAAPVCKLWLNRLNDFQQQISPAARAKMVNDDYAKKIEKPQDAPGQALQSPSLKR